MKRQSIRYLITPPAGRRLRCTLWGYVFLALTAAFLPGFPTAAETEPAPEPGAVIWMGDMSENVTEAGTEYITEEAETSANGEMDSLQAAINEEISAWPGTWSVSVTDLETGGYIEINSGPMRSASLIKLYIMGSVYEEISKGNLEETPEIDGLLNDMITVSDNEASNELVRRLTSSGIHEDGMTVVNDFAKTYGYPDTSQGRDMRDFREVPAEGENYTSVHDCALFLQQIYAAANVSEEFSEKMLALLCRQTRTWKIPAGLPQGVPCGNKTGEVSGVENDAAIVFGGDYGARDYILCVMTDDLPDADAGQQNIVLLSSQVWDWFCNIQ